MSAHILLTAVLDKSPARLTSKAGKTYLRASVKDGKGPDAKWWTIFVFSETAIEALEVLAEGEAFAATGTFEASVWAPEGREPRVSLTLSADAILSARKPKPAAEKPKETGSSQSREKVPNNGRAIANTSWAAPHRAAVETPHAQKGEDFDDDIPF
jgi:hypothetical protein